jgi:hypothetical protein
VSLKRRVERLEAQFVAPRGVSIWDLIAGAVNPKDVDEEDIILPPGVDREEFFRDLAEMARTPVRDTVEQKIQEMLAEGRRDERPRGNGRKGRAP